MQNITVKLVIQVIRSCYIGQVCHASNTGHALSASRANTGDHVNHVQNADAITEQNFI